MNDALITLSPDVVTATKHAFNALRNIAKSVQSHEQSVVSADSSIAGLPAIRASRVACKPLTDKERAVWSLLKTLPDGKGMTSGSIQREAAKLTPSVYLEVSEITGRIIPGLKRKGYKVGNLRDGSGYFPIRE